MEVKAKKCKGQNKAFGFEGCGKLSKYRKYGLCPSCLSKWFNTTNIGREYLNSLTIKSKNILTKEKNKNNKKLKDELTDWSKKLQVKINYIIRLIDKGLPCLARNIKAKQIHAGHVFARGGNQTIRYNLHNIHRQSAQSNHYQNDDGLLREGLINEYGQDYMNFIGELRQTPTLKYSNDQYKEFTKKASKIALRIKQINEPYNKLERIDIRNKVNIDLGIYDDKFCEFISE